MLLKLIKMFSLINKNINIKSALKAHFDFFKPFIKNKIKNKTDYKFFYDFLNKNGNLENIIVGSPQNLSALNDAFIQLVNKEYGNTSYQTYIKLSKTAREKCTTPIALFFKKLGLIFNYTVLGKNDHYNSYDLTTNLGIRSCAYCNRIYTLTKWKKSKGRLMSPQLDHWFPQSKYPLLQISFYNLIPSCEICNARSKSDTLFNLKDHFHPYSIEDENEELHLKYKLGVKDKYSIYFDSFSTAKIKRTCEEMSIDDMYNAHQYELDDLIKIKQAYSDKYLEKLKDAFPKANLSKEEIYRLVFGTEINIKNFHKRPMSKFKHDILKEIGVI